MSFESSYSFYANYFDAFCLHLKMLYIVPLFNVKYEVDSTHLFIYLPQNFHIHNAVPLVLADGEFVAHRQLL